MVINVTEQQKNFIESQGYMVVEFKARVKKHIEFVSRWSSRVIQAIENVWNLIISFLEQMEIQKIFKRLSFEFMEIVNKVKDVVDNPIPQFAYEEREKYPFVRSIGRKYEPRYRQPIYLHRCRNNC